MMISITEKAFKKIADGLAISRLELENRQSVGDYGLNLYAENYFRDILNFVYGYQLESLNKNQINAPYVDLIDQKNKLIFQITSTKTKEKIENTLLALKKRDYRDYDLKILYLLGKPSPKTQTVDSIFRNYGVNLRNCLIDYNDLLRDIKNLENEKLIKLSEKYFENQTRYTNEIILNLIIKHLLLNMSNKEINYLMDTTSIETNNKIKLNNLNGKISAEIRRGIDYVYLINKFDNEDNLVSLRHLIVEVYYQEILKKFLSVRFKSNEIQSKSIDYLHQLSREIQLDFNHVITNLYHEIKKEIIVNDFNSMDIAWILISYYFEICDVGIK